MAEQFNGEFNNEEVENNNPDGQKLKRWKNIEDSAKKSLEFKEGEKVILPEGAEFYISQLGKENANIKAENPVKVEIIAQDYGQVNVRLLEDINGNPTKDTCGWVKKSSINPGVQF